MVNKFYLTFSSSVDVVFGSFDACLRWSDHLKVNVAFSYWFLRNLVFSSFSVVIFLIVLVPSIVLSIETFREVSFSFIKKNVCQGNFTIVFDKSLYET